jgi:hypothetical protein
VLAVAVGCNGAVDDPRPSSAPAEALARTSGALSSFDLAFHWAPVHYQDVNKKSGTGLKGRSDYIVAFDYDGDFNGRNNWDNMQPSSTNPQAHMYFSVSESDSHWFVYYVAYHPRDWAAGIAQEHENDGEGCILLVRKDGTQFGVLETVTTVFHAQWRSYRAQSYIGRGPNNPETPQLIQTELFGGVARPRTYQEPQGHGFIGCTASSNCVRADDGIRYVPSAVAGVPPLTIPDGQQVTVGYSLIDMTSLTSRRYDAPTFVNSNAFAGDSSGSCGEGFSTCADNAATGIWSQSDERTNFDDGSLPGEDPAAFMSGWYTFGALRAPSANYGALKFLHQKCTVGRRMQGSSDACVAQICETDSFCCTNSWDATCVAEVGSLCGEQCSACEANICAVQSGPIGSGCDGQCAQTVCASDSFCCSNQWDSACVGEVASLCHLTCF